MLDNIDVTFRRMKSLRMRVADDGRIKISAPKRTPQFIIKRFVTENAHWIADKQAAANQPPQTLRIWGKDYKIVYKPPRRAHRVQICDDIAKVYALPCDTVTIIKQFQKQQLLANMPPLIAKWEERLGVTVAKTYTQSMTSRWGSCNPVRRTIRLNTKLAQFPKICLDYVILHEIAHFFEANHGKAFKAILSKHMPNWREVEAVLKS